MIQHLYFMMAGTVTRSGRFSCNDPSLSLHVGVSNQFLARYGALDEPTFKVSSQNKLTELSELRLELRSSENEFDLTCKLVFGKMHYEHNSREYEVGVSRAHLRLTLEGCETALLSNYGEDQLTPVVEESKIEDRAFSGFEISASAGADLAAGLKLHAGANNTQSRNLSQHKVSLPVTERPNNSWEVQAKNVFGKSEDIIEGTALPGVLLCRIRRKNGHNRLAVIGEVQVAKSAIKVCSKGGNRSNKAFLEWRNKDAIVAQVLKRALQREASASLPGQSTSTVVIARSECCEE